MNYSLPFNNTTPSIGNADTATTIITSIINNSSTISCPTAEFNGFHISMAILGVLIILVNMFVFFFINCSRQVRRNADNLTLMGLSFNDTVTGICLLFHIVPNYYYVYQKCDEYSLHVMFVISTAAYLTNKITLLCAVGHLLLLAGERMIGLFLPLHYKSLVVTKRVLPAIITVWVISITIPPLELTYQQSPNRMLYTKIQAGFTIIAFGVIPTVLLCLQYIAMLTVIYKFQKTRVAKIKTVFENHKAFFIYLVMFLSFLFLTLPYFAVRSIAVFTSDFYNIPMLLTRIIITLRFVPSLVNPIVYAVFKDDFCHAFIRWKRYYTKRKLSEPDTTRTFLLSMSETRNVRSTIVVSSKQ